MKMKKWILAAFVALMSVSTISLPVQPAIAQSASTQKAQSPAEAFVADMGQQVITLANKKSQLSPEQVKINLTTVFRKYFDMPTIGRFVLGQYWRNTTPAQQQEYQQLFEQMAVSVYTQRFNQYAGQNLQVTSSEPTSGSQDVLVKSTITGDQPFDVNWRVRPAGGSFKVVDVIVENVSMSITQRSDFASVVEKSGGQIEGLLVDMRRRAATGTNSQQ